MGFIHPLFKGDFKMRNDELQHAFGWTKKNHKYIRKEGDRYIYPEDLQKGGTSGGLFGSKKKQKQAEVNARIDAEQRRLEAVNRMNAVEKQRNIAQRRQVQQQSNIPTSARNAQAKQNQIRQQAMNERASRMNALAKRRALSYELSKQNIPGRNPSSQFREHQVNRELADNVARANGRARRDSYNRNQELLAKANANRAQSQSNETARDVLSRRGVKRVAYANAKLPDGSTSTVRREITNNGAQDKIVSRNSNRSARDVISKRGTKSVKYTDNTDGSRTRTTVNKDYTRSNQAVDKNTVRVDARSSLKKALQKAGLFKSKADRAWNKLVKSESKARKTGITDEQKAREAALPFKNRMQLKAKRGKKALGKFFDNFKETNETKSKTDGGVNNTKSDKKTEKYIDEQGRTVIPMNETYVWDKRAKKYVKVNK